MLQRFRTYFGRNVVAFLALFIALGGTAVAARPLLTGADIQDESLTGSDIADGSLAGADVQNGSLTGADLSDNAIASSKVVDGSLRVSDVSATQFAVGGTFSNAAGIAPHTCSHFEYNAPSVQRGDLVTWFVPDTVDPRIIAPTTQASVDATIRLALCNVGDDAISVQAEPTGGGYIEATIQRR